MAGPDVGAIADRLFRGFMAPLVLGGEMTPHKPIGPQVALMIGEERVAADPELVSHVQLARVRRARQLVALDRLATATPVEWALAAALHDIVQSTHPGFDAAFRRKSAAKLLGLVEQALELVPRVTSVGDALSRHTWFARAFEITRTDTVVSWWVGKRTFLGTTPPSRLTSWPELRRVNVVKTPRALVELPSSGATVDAPALDRALDVFLARTPLTDLATMTRAEPAFEWTPETLALVAVRGGQTLALRALAREPHTAVDAALGRATRVLFGRGAWQAARPALDLLSERALAEALSGGGPGARPQGSDAKGTDVLFARAAGALSARERVLRGEIEMLAEERRRVLAALEGAVAPSAAKEVEAALAAGAAGLAGGAPPQQGA
jgi:hypothetical protein